MSFHIIYLTNPFNLQYVFLFKLCYERHLPGTTIDVLEPMLNEIFWLKDVNEGMSPDEKLSKLCETLVKRDLAFVSFDITKPTIQKVVRRERVTIADLLGSLGGTLGLFTGMSMLSIAEVIFWIYKLVMRSVLRCTQPEWKDPAAR